MKITKQTIVGMIGGLIMGLVAMIVGIVLMKPTNYFESDNSATSYSEVKNTSAHGTDLNELAQLLPEMMDKIQNLEAQVPRQNSEPTTADDSAPTGEVETVQHENNGYNPSDEEILAQIRSEMDFLDDVIQSEAADASWSDSAETLVYDSWLNDPDIGFAVENVNCGSTLCRFEMAFNGPVSQDSFDGFGERLPWVGEVFFHLEDPQDGNAIVYIAREGYSLPQFTN